MPFRTTPDDSPAMPPGVPYIVGNEAAERFSFYGMKAILYVFLTEHLTGASGVAATMDATEAKVWVHSFNTAVYLCPLLGAILSDWRWGKYRTILWLSLAYCLGHVAMALVDVPQWTGFDPRATLLVALGLIALASGGIKPCVWSHLGDQFGRRNANLLPKVFSWFYFSVNLGAFVSTLLTPLLLKEFGPGVAFGVPGMLMALATLVFWLGRNRFVHVPPAGDHFWNDALSGEGLAAIVRLLPLLGLLAVFWCLFDQTATTWVEQAKHMDCNVLGFTLEPAQTQALNPILVLLLIPVFTLVVYPWFARRWPLSPLRRIGLGMCLAPLAFAIAALAQTAIDGGATPHIGWQALATLVLTAAEVLVSITAVEFAYTQAPPTMKAIVTGLYWMSVAAGNGLTVLVNLYIQSRDKKGEAVLEGADYYWFFTVAMAVAAAMYVVWSRTYRERAYLQGER
ncbi:MAG: POT family MFS transporter [Lacipirellulaceae bacterium]